MPLGDGERSVVDQLSSSASTQKLCWSDGHHRSCSRRVWSCCGRSILTSLLLVRIAHLKHSLADLLVARTQCPFSVVFALSVDVPSSLVRTFCRARCHEAHPVTIFQTLTQLTRQAE